MVGFYNKFDKVLYPFFILLSYLMVYRFWFKQVVGSEVSDVSVDWGMPDASTLVHPIYFSKCLTKVTTAWFDKYHIRYYPYVGQNSTKKKKSEVPLIMLASSDLTI